MKGTGQPSMVMFWKPCQPITNGPKPWGRTIVLRLFVDAIHAGNMLTQRSRTGYGHVINNDVVNLYLKKQGSIVTSIFGSEFVA